MRSLRPRSSWPQACRAQPRKRRRHRRSACSSAAIDTGIEEVTVLESADGWTLRGSGKLRAPVNLAMDYWEARYDRTWKPIELTINLTESAKKWTVHTTFSGTTASSDITQDGQIQRAVAARWLPTRSCCRTSSSARTRRSPPGSRRKKSAGSCRCSSHRRMRCPRRSHSVTDETIKVPGRSIAARRWTLHMGGGVRKARDGSVDRRQPRCCVSTFPRRCSPCCATTSPASRPGS